jgi:hypothetical protein
MPHRAGWLAGGRVIAIHGVGATLLLQVSRRPAGHIREASGEPDACRREAIRRGCLGAAGWFGLPRRVARVAAELDVLRLDAAVRGTARRQREQLAWPRPARPVRRTPTARAR